MWHPAPGSRRCRPALPLPAPSTSRLKSPATTTSPRAIRSAWAVRIRRTSWPYRTGRVGALRIPSSPMPEPARPAPNRPRSGPPGRGRKRSPNATAATCFVGEGPSARQTGPASSEPSRGSASPTPQRTARSGVSALSACRLPASPPCPFQASGCSWRRLRIAWACPETRRLWPAGSSGRLPPALPAPTVPAARESRRARAPARRCGGRCRRGSGAPPPGAGPSGPGGPSRCTACPG